MQPGSTALVRVGDGVEPRNLVFPFGVPPTPPIMPAPAAPGTTHFQPPPDSPDTTDSQPPPGGPGKGGGKGKGKGGGTGKGKGKAGDKGKAAGKKGIRGKAKGKVVLKKPAGRGKVVLENPAGKGNVVPEPPHPPPMPISDSMSPSATTDGQEFPLAEHEFSHMSPLAYEQAALAFARRIRLQSIRRRASGLD